MKLYSFSSGILKSQKHFFIKGESEGIPFDVPVPYYVIEHERGLVLFDTGNALEVAQGKVEHWGDVVQTYDPVMTEDQWCVNAVKALDYQPENVTHVIQSHLHLDHAGGIGLFPNATYIVQRSEYEFAMNPPEEMRPAYIQADIEKDVDWLFLEGECDDRFDLFGDNSLICHFTPGHTPGHMSLQVNLENDSSIVLAVDACYTEENLTENKAPGLCWNEEKAIQSMNRFHLLHKLQGLKIVPGHDPEGWKKVKKFPEFYS